jgi:hypothetical protein
MIGVCALVAPSQSQYARFVIHWEDDPSSIL